MIIIFTGNGKGKTSAAIGTMIRSLGYHRKVLFVQFFKNQMSGEIPVLEKLGIDVLRAGTSEFVNQTNFDENKNLMMELMITTSKYHSEKKYDLIVLDEFTFLIYFKMISGEEALNFINELIKINDCDIVITGRYADKILVDSADLVSEINEVKHPFKKGVPAKEGIDY
ncbi:MAG: cob(I)yrinic acid a,c-diamide adenosyltransferase [Candidatus Woesearchaeota archaeon]